MKHNNRLRIAGIVAALCLSMVVPAMADTKEQVQQQIHSLENQQNDLEAELAALKNSQTDVRTYITELDSKIQEILDRLGAVSDEILATDEEIEDTKEKLAKAMADRETQYNALKARIKAIYEAGDSGNYLELLFGAADLKDVMNVQEYRARINMYDYNLLDTLEKSAKKIEAYEKTLEEKEEQLLESKTEYENEKQQLETVYQERQAELEGLEDEISGMSYDLDAVKNAIDAQTSKMADIIEQERIKAAEEAARKEAEKKAAQKAEAQKKAEEAKKRQEREKAEAEAKAEAERQRQEEEKRQLASQTQSGSWNGPVLSRSAGTVMGPSGKETYYNLNMSGVVSIMRGRGFSEEEYPYWVRDDGCKMLGPYIMCAANLNVRPRGTTVECSLGTALVCDTGGFAYSNPTQLDIATNW